MNEKMVFETKFMVWESVMHMECCSRQLLIYVVQDESYQMKKFERPQAWNI